MIMGIAYVYLPKWDAIWAVLLCQWTFKTIRNLDAYEMVQQVLLAEKDLGERIDSVVIME